MLMYAVIMVDKSGEWIESCDSYWCESGLWTDGKQVLSIFNNIRTLGLQY